MPRRILVSFADSRLRPSARRLARQAAALGAYDRIAILDERGLQPTFRRKYGHRLIPGSRGYGYWVWKPEVVRQVMAECAEGDLVHYVDVGCHLHPPGRHRLETYFAMAAESPTGLMAFEARPPDAPHVRWDGRPLPDLRDRLWTKGDLLDHFDVRHRPDVVETPTVEATHFVTRCGPAARDFLAAWSAVWAADFALADDSPSRRPNLPGFIEHRHDQAIFSILCKTRGVPRLSSFEHWYPRWDDVWRPDWQALDGSPIHARRDTVLSRWCRWRQSIRRRAQSALHRAGRVAWAVGRGRRA